MLASAGHAQTLDLGPVPKPQQNTTDALAMRFIAASERAQSDRERAIISLASRLARTGDPVDELAARTIERHLEELTGAVRAAEAAAASGETPPVIRQRLRERLIRFDASAQTAASDADLRRSAERLLGDLAQLERAAHGDEDPMPPASLRTDRGSIDAVALRTRLAELPESLEPFAARLAELIDLYDGVRSVPALEQRGIEGLDAIGGVLDLALLPTERFIPRSAAQQLPSALESCLIDGSSVRDPLRAQAMLGVLARIGALVERCAPLEGDTARRVEPVLRAMLLTLRTPEDAEMLGLTLTPLERSLGLVARGAALPSAGAVSAQLQFAWRFLLPQEQSARIVAIEAISAIVGDPSSMASPDTVSALIAHAELVESLESLLGVDVLQQELDEAGVPGAFPALETLRKDLRMMGDREGYRAAGARVLPIVRTLARYRSMPGAEELAAEHEGEPEWTAALRALLDERLGALRVRLAMELIGGGSDAPTDPERFDAQRTLETLRRVVASAADVLVLTTGGMDRLDALPQFEAFGDGASLGVRGVMGLDELSEAMAEAIGALERDDAQRAAAILDGLEGRLVIAGVLAEMASRVDGLSEESAATRALECALVWRRVESFNAGAGPLVQLSLTGTYSESGLDRRALVRYAADQAERTIDGVGWLREAWQRRR